MRDKTLTPTLIYEQYLRGVRYNESIGLYETVKQNENFFIGKQWEGVNAPDLEKPVNNILKRVVSYFESMIVSDDISARVEPNENDRERYGGDVTKYINMEIERVLEHTQAKKLGREALRDAAVDGDAIFHVFWDSEYSDGNTSGAIELERIDNTCCIFGDPGDDRVQKQPYIILAYRVNADDVSDEAKENGFDGDIPPDSEDTDQPNRDTLPNDDMATVLLRYWRDKKTKTIHFCKTTPTRWIKKDVDTGLTLYPVAMFGWERVKNSYHAQAAITGLIPNQIAINKLQAMLIKSVKDLAFPKIVYDATKVQKWTNRIGEAIAVYGDPNLAVARVLQGAAITPQVQQLINDLIALTKDTMGASDAALGNLKNPDNTSAIIATQQAASAPLELQKMAFYQWIEDYVRIFLDFMCVYYGRREVYGVEEQTGAEYKAELDYSDLRGIERALEVNVGASAYWSELTQIQTADNLLKNNIIDQVTYLDMIPKSYIKNKGAVMQKAIAYKVRAEQMQEQAALAAQGGQNSFNQQEQKNAADRLDSMTGAMG